MTSKKFNTALIALTALSVTALSAARADRLELTDGTVLSNCFIRDEGPRVLVWEKMPDVGGPARAIARSQIRDFKIERDQAWDAHLTCLICR